MSGIKLSVMVISHNQAHLICRCLDSILAQQISAPWEIVISDDASTDNTWNVIQEYVQKYSEIKKEGEWYLPIIRAFQINSSDYNPTVTSDRCAANKANVYVHAQGQYCVNIDADDYLLGNDIYQYQINQLEAHPECATAIQNIWYQNNGESVEQGHAWHTKEIWKENEIITLEDYYSRRAFVSNPAIMMRRDEGLVPMRRYGLLFDDPIISIHHLKNGKIICSQKAQYVYVQYTTSIWNQVENNACNKLVRYLTVYLVYFRFYPELKKSFLEMELYNWIRTLKTIIKVNTPMQLDEETQAYLDRLHSKGLERIIKNNRVYLVTLLYLSLLISKTGLYEGVLAYIWNRMVK